MCVGIVQHVFEFEVQCYVFETLCATFVVFSCPSRSDRLDSQFEADRFGSLFVFCGLRSLYRYGVDVLWMLVSEWCRSWTMAFAFHTAVRGKAW